MAWRKSTDTSPVTMTNTDAGYVLLGVSEYWQSVGVEHVPTYMIDGNAGGFMTLDIRFKVKETSEEWRGLDEDTAKSFGTSSIETQQTGGTAVYVKKEVRINRQRTNEARGWTVTRVTTQRALYFGTTRQNGEAI